MLLTIGRYHHSNLVLKLRLKKLGTICDTDDALIKKVTKGTTVLIILDECLKPLQITANVADNI